MNGKRRKEGIDVLRLGILELLKNLDFMRSIGDGAVLVQDGALVILRINIDDLDGGHTIVNKITAMFRYQYSLDSSTAGESQTAGHSLRFENTTIGAFTDELQEFVHGELMVLPPQLLGDGSLLFTSDAYSISPLACHDVSIVRPKVSSGPNGCHADNAKRGKSRSVLQCWRCPNGEMRILKAEQSLSWWELRCGTNQDSPKPPSLYTEAAMLMIDVNA